MSRSNGIAIAALFVAVVVEAVAGQGGTAQAPASSAAPRAAAAGPVLVLETAKGTVEIEMFPGEAPKTVAHITALAKRNFYNGLRIHRVVPGFVVQFGDPLTRDMTKKESWGTGSSGKAIGAAEMNPKHTHTLGAVAMAHSGDPSQADSQMYITLAPQPRLDKDYTVFGQVISGMDVVQNLAAMDVIKRVTVKAKP